MKTKASETRTFAVAHGVRHLPPGGNTAMDAQHKTYADGLRDGRIENLEAITKAQQDRSDGYSRRLHTLERIMYMLAGVVAFIQLVPLLKQFLSGNLQ